MSELKFHEAANIFPLDEEHIDELAADINERGLEVPIELLDGKIIDGRRRYLACKKLKLEPEFVEVETDDPVGYVLSLNLHRRHLSIREKGIIAGKAAILWKKMGKEALDRMAAGGGDKKSTAAQKKTGVAPGPHPIQGRKSRDDIGELFGISGRHAERGRIVVEKGIPELVDAVMKQDLPLQTAEVIAKMPRDKQLAALREERHTRTNGKKRPGPSHEQMEAMASTAMNFAGAAIAQLAGIRTNDPDREKAFTEVETWIQSQRKRK